MKRISGFFKEWALDLYYRSNFAIITLGGVVYDLITISYDLETKLQIVFSRTKGSVAKAYIIGNGLSLDEGYYFDSSLFSKDKSVHNKAYSSYLSDIKSIIESNSCLRDYDLGELLLKMLESRGIHLVSSVKLHDVPYNRTTFSRVVLTYNYPSDMKKSDFTTIYLQTHYFIVKYLENSCKLLLSENKPKNRVINYLFSCYMSRKLTKPFTLNQFLD